MEEIKVNIQGVTVENNELVIRTGEALDQKEPLKYAVSGTVGSLEDYLLKRKELLNPDVLVIEMNEDTRAITVRRDPNDPLADTITGKIEENPALAKFGINTDKKFSREALAKLIKFNRVYFENNAFTSLLVQVNDFTAKIEASMNQASDNRGNKTNNYQRQVMSDIDMNFKLTMPIFKGGEHKSFFVDIAFDVSDNGVLFWLESVELAELKAEWVTACFADFRSKFSQYVTIEQ